MATVCFDLQRIDDDYVAIRHCKIGTSEYNLHRALHFTNKPDARKKYDWLFDKKYRYIWVLIGYDPEKGKEDICFVCNDKTWSNQVKKDYDKKQTFIRHYSSTRLIKLPFEKVTGFRPNSRIPYFKLNDLGEDEFVLYIPIKTARLRDDGSEYFI